MNVKLLTFIVFTPFLFWACTKVEPSPNNGGSGSSGSTTWPTSSNYQFYTNFSEDWDNWKIKLGDTTVSVTTAFSEDWDNWDYSTSGNTGDIKTNFSEDWDNWKLTNSGWSIQMRTAFSEDWDNWDIDDANSSWHCDAKTSFSENFDNWDIYENGNHILDISTTYSDDFDGWRVYGEFPMEWSLEQKLSVLFVPIFISACHMQGITE